MICFVAPQGQTFGVDEYLEQGGRSLQGRLVGRTYDQVLRGDEPAAACYVFAGTDQLTPTEWTLACRLWDALSASRPPPRLLNDPRRVMHRHELLTTAHALGRNEFRAIRVGAVPADLRFPVFLRLEREHTGNLSPLLQDRRALRRALRRLRMRGYHPCHLLVVEYCDASGGDGLHRKFSAYAVGGPIIPCHLMRAPQWMTKSEVRALDEDAAREELEYVRCDSHAAWLRDTFAMARIDYGRIDYGVRGDRPQVWEINLNPTLGRRTGRPSRMTDEQRALRAPARDHVAARFVAAWKALDGPAPGYGSPRIEVTSQERRRLEAERGERRRIEARRALVGRLSSVPLLYRLYRAWKKLRNP